MTTSRILQFNRRPTFVPRLNFWSRKRARMAKKNATCCCLFFQNRCWFKITYRQDFREKLKKPKLKCLIQGSENCQQCISKLANCWSCDFSLVIIWKRHRSQSGKNRPCVHRACGTLDVCPLLPLSPMAYSSIISSTKKGFCVEIHSQFPN